VTGGGNTFPNGCARFPRCSVGNGLDWQRGHRHDEIEAVAQWPRDPTPICGNLAGRAAARATLVTGKSTRTWIHRGHQDEPSRKYCRPCRSGDCHATFFERLPEDLEHASIELGHLVEEQDAVVRQ
jgi:hypothetical protein